MQQDQQELKQDDCYTGVIINTLWGFPSGSDGKESASNEGDPGSIPGSERSPEEGKGTHSSILARIPGTEEPGRLSGNFQN